LIACTAWVRGHLSRKRLEALAVPPQPISSVAAKAATLGKVEAGKPKMAAGPARPATNALARAGAGAPVAVKKNVAAAPPVPVAASLGSKLLALRRRWRANKQWVLAPVEQRMGFQTNSAINTLLYSKTLASMLVAAKKLESSTALSHGACVEAVESQIVPVLFSLMQQANRSTPYLELVKHAQQTIINIIQHPSLVATVFQTQTAPDVLVDQLQMYKERDDLVMNAAILIALGVETPRFASVRLCQRPLVFLDPPFFTSTRV
jgi:hypothetical protein